MPLRAEDKLNAGQIVASLGLPMILMEFAACFAISSHVDEDSVSRTVLNEVMQISHCNPLQVELIVTPHARARAQFEIIE